MTAREWLTPRQVADELGVNRETVYDAVARGDLFAVRLGRTIRVPRWAVPSSGPPNVGDSGAVAGSAVDSHSDLEGNRLSDVGGAP